MQTDTRHKRGDRRPDGKVFVSYQSKCVGGEWWVSEDKFQKVMAAIKSRRSKNRDTIREQQRRWTQANIEKERIRKTKWRLDNPELRKEVVRRSRLKYSDRDREKNRCRNRRYMRENPVKRAVVEARRRALQYKQTPELCDRQLAIIKALYEARTKISNCLGIPHHVDHIVPLSKGGLHHPSNLQILPARINLQKHDKLGFSIHLHD